MTKPVTSATPSTRPSAGLPQPALAAEAIAHVLRPLARLMIDHGLQLPSMLELLKKALVDEAVGSFALQQKGTTDTRIALLSGVHRKDVKRLRDSPTTKVDPSSMMPVAASVVARWISDPRFLNADHSPRPLAKSPGKSLPGEPDFSALVSEVSRDVGARAVLDELARLGVVQLREDGYVELMSTSFVPQEGLSESFQFLSLNVSDHLATAVHNLNPTRTTPAMLEQSAFSTGLSEDQVLELQRLARRLWTQALQQFLLSATIAEQRSHGSAGPGRRVRFGVYCFDELEPSVPALASPPSAKRKVKRSEST